MSAGDEREDVEGWVRGISERLADLAVRDPEGYREALAMIEEIAGRCRVPAVTECK